MSDEDEDTRSSCVVACGRTRSCRALTAWSSTMADGRHKSLAEMGPGLITCVSPVMRVAATYTPVPLYF